MFNEKANRVSKILKQKNLNIYMLRFNYNKKLAGTPSDLSKRRTATLP